MKLSVLIFAGCLTTLTTLAQSPEHRNGKPMAVALNDSAVARYMRHMDSEDSVKAVFRLFDKALKIDSGYYDGWLNKMSLHCRLGDYKTGLSTLRRMERLFPNDEGVLLYTGILLYQSGNTVGAMGYFNRLLAYYDNVLRGAKPNSVLQKNTQISKGKALILANKVAEGKALLRKIHDADSNPFNKSYLAFYINSSREEIIHDMVPGQ